MAEKLVTLARFATLGEAYLARSLLESAGVAAVVLEQDRLRLDLFRQQPEAGVRVQVRASDVARAREILASPAPEDADSSSAGEPTGSP